MSLLKSLLTVGFLVAVGCETSKEPTVDATRKVVLPAEVAPEPMTLFSIDGNSYEKGDPNSPANTPGREILHRWPVLGKVRIEDAAERQEVWDALRTGIAQFNPAASNFKCNNLFAMLPEQL